jgi:hypothetical protein
MVKHIVMWRLLDYAEEHTKEHNKLTLKEKLMELGKNIPEVVSLEVKFNIKDNASKNYDICLIADFESYADLHEYQAHNEHLKVIEFVKKIRQDRACIDYEF